MKRLQVCKVMEPSKPPKKRIKIPPKVQQLLDDMATRMPKDMLDRIVNDIYKVPEEPTVIIHGRPGIGKAGSVTMALANVDKNTTMDQAYDTIINQLSKRNKS